MYVREERAIEPKIKQQASPQLLKFSEINKTSAELTKGTSLKGILIVSLLKLVNSFSFPPNNPVFSC